LGQSPDYSPKLQELVLLENVLFLIWAWIRHIDRTHVLVFACQCNGRARLEGMRVENPVLPRTKGTLQVLLDSGELCQTYGWEPRSQLGQSLFGRRSAQKAKMVDLEFQRR